MVSCLVLYLTPILLLNGSPVTLLFTYYQWMMVFAAIPPAMYNGERGIPRAGCSTGSTRRMCTPAVGRWEPCCWDKSRCPVWRYSVVAQGSGTFRGIVVADDVAPVRFGDLGRYQLRAMTQGEIALTEEPFSKTIVEWNWNDRQNDLTPEIGEGEIDKYDATQAGSPDFNNVVYVRATAAELPNRRDWCLMAASCSRASGGISTRTKANISTSRSRRRASPDRT